MKNNNRRLKRQNLSLYIFLFISFFPFSFNSYSQTIIDACNSDQMFTGIPHLKSVDIVNCDMINRHNDGKLIAVVYSGVNGGNNAVRQLYVGYDGTDAFDIVYNLPANTGINMDVVIADDILNKTGEDYVIMVVYENSGLIYEKRYPVTGIGSSHAWGTATTRQVSGVGNDARYPHIDLAGDITNTVTINSNTSYALEHYAITWEEDISGTTNVMIDMGSVSTSGTVSSVYSSGIGGVYPDIACRGWKTVSGSTPHDIVSAYVAFIDLSSSNLMMSEVVMNSAGSLAVQSVPTVLDAISNAAESFPRIEAKGVGDVSSTEATYDVVYSPHVGTQWQVLSINDVSPAPMVVTCTLNSTNDHLKPVVAGVGVDICSGGCSGVGADQYSISYYTDYTNINGCGNSSNSNGDFFANAVDITGTNAGIISASYPDFYEINNNDLGELFAYNGPFPAIAVASSSNDGDDLLTVWYDGYPGAPGIGDLRYKFNNNSYAYKTGNAVNSINKARGLNVFPNPATEQLTVNGVANAAYSITDMLGRTVGNGAIDAQHNKVVVAHLVNGAYIININENGNIHKVKFAKQ
jgi:hypothetical protein